MNFLSTTQALHLKNEVQNNVLHIENGFQNRTFHVENWSQNRYQNGWKMNMHFQNEFTFSHCFETLRFQGLSYGVSKKILHQKMHEWKIASKISHFDSKFGGYFMIAHGAWFEVSKIISICLTCDYYVGIKETWLEKLSQVWAL